MNRRNYLKTLGALGTTTLATTTTAAGEPTETPPSTESEGDYVWSSLDTTWVDTRHSDRAFHNTTVRQWDPDEDKSEETDYQFNSTVDYAHHNPTGEIFVNIETKTPVDIEGIDVVDVSTYEHNETRELVFIVAADNPVMDPPENPEPRLFSNEATVKIEDSEYTPTDIDYLRIRFDAFTPNPWSTQRRVEFEESTIAVDYTNEQRHVTLPNVLDAVDHYREDEITRNLLDKIISNYDDETDVLLRADD